MANSANISQLCFLNLPLDILINILNKLDISDLRNVMLTCQTLRHIISTHNDIWRLLVHKHFTITSISNRNLSLYNQFRLSHNWQKGFFKNKVIIHQNINYMPWLRLFNRNLVLSFGSTLCCYHLDNKGITNQRWKIVVPKKVNVGVRTNDISRFLIKNNNIVCGNRNGSVSVYNLRNVKNQPTLDCYIEDCHNNGNIEVSTVEITESYHNPCIISASNDSPIVKFWKPKVLVSDHNDNLKYSKSNRYQKKPSQSERDIPIGQCVGIRCLSMDKSESKLALGLNGNSKPFLLDIKTGKSLLNMESSLNTREVIRDIHWHNEHTVAFVTHSGLLQLDDIRSAETIFARSGLGNEFEYCVQYHDVSTPVTIENSATKVDEFMYLGCTDRLARRDIVFKAIDPFRCTLYCVRTDGNRAMIVGSSQYSRCVLYDNRHSLKHVQMYFTQKQASPIYSLDFDPWKLIAAADRSVAALNFDVSVATTAQRDNSFAFEHFTTS